MSQLVAVRPDSPAAFIDRELSWLSFARRVLALAADPEQPLLERVKFAGIMGMICDEFAMKRIGGLFQRVRQGESKRGPAGLTPAEVLEICRAELRSQQALVADLVEGQLRPALRDLGIPILAARDLDPSQRDFLARYFADSVEPILTPLAADAAHPFPFISNLGLNLAIQVTEPGRRNPHFVRIKVPANRPRWVPLPDHAGWVPLEQVIADNLSALFPRASELAWSFFRVTRGAKDDPWADQVADGDVDLSPGAIIEMVTAELTARKYAGVMRVEVSADMPSDRQGWLVTQLDADPADVIVTPGFKLFPGRTQAEYYSGLFHELVHWVGHPTRLDRPLGFDEESEAKEELVAELGAALLCAEFSIDDRISYPHADYVYHFFELLDEDPRALFTAVLEAKAAVDFLHQLFDEKHGVTEKGILDDYSTSGLRRNQLTRAAKKTQLAELRYPIVGEEAEELLDQLYPERDVIAYDEACDEKL